MQNESQKRRRSYKLLSPTLLSPSPIIFPLDQFFSGDRRRRRRIIIGFSLGLSRKDGCCGENSAVYAIIGLLQSGIGGQSHAQLWSRLAPYGCHGTAARFSLKVVKISFYSQYYCIRGGNMIMVQYFLTLVCFYFFSFFAGWVCFIASFSNWLLASGFRILRLFSLFSVEHLKFQYNDFALVFSISIVLSR